MQNLVESTTEVAVVGGGPAGLMLSHLLQRAGVASVVVEHRSRAEIESTARAAILESERGAARRVRGLGPGAARGARPRRDLAAVRRRAPPPRLQALVGASAWLYPQTDVDLDLARARERGGDVRNEVRDTEVHDLTTDAPSVTFTNAECGPSTSSAPTARAACAAGRSPRPSAPS